MSHRLSALSFGTLALGALLLFAPSAGAQTAPGATTAPSPAPAPATRSRTAKPAESTAPARQPTPGQSAARDRQRQCGAEWKQAKAAGKVAAGMKWPQYWSQCNTRLKQQKA